MEVGGPPFEALSGEVLGVGAPNLSIEGGGVVFDDGGVLRDMNADVGGAEVLGVSEVGPNVGEGGLPTHLAGASDGACDGADEGDVGGLRLVVVQELDPRSAEDLAGAGLGVALELGPWVD